MLYREGVIRTSESRSNRSGGNSLTKIVVVSPLSLVAGVVVMMVLPAVRAAHKQASKISCVKLFKTDHL